LWRLIANRQRPLVIYYHEVFDINDDVAWCQQSSLLMPFDLFTKQIVYLSNHYKIVSLDEMIAGSQPGTAAITFDDGFRGVYSRAFPVLKAFRLPATVFLATDYVGTSECPWWERLRSKIIRFKDAPYDQRARAIVGLSDKWKTLLTRKCSVDSVITAYKESSTVGRSELDNALGEDSENSFSNSQRIFLSEQEIKEMAANGISFGSHSKSHPILMWLDDKSLLEELKGSKEAVERLTNPDHIWFSYPDGMFTPREKKAVQEMGFVGAVQTFRHAEHCDLFALPRVGMSVMSLTGFNGRFLKAKTEVTLAALTKERISLLFQNKQTKEII